MIKATNIVKQFGDLKVLRGVSLEIKRGEVVAITGASGAGKTTMLQILGTLMSADEGSVEIDGVEVSHLKDSELSKFRNERIGFVFQFHNLLAEFSAMENISLPGYIGGRDHNEVEQYAHELIKMMGIEARADHKPSAMSGGEQQRVAIARALINNPSVLLADEPSGNLDSVNRTEIHNLFFELRDKLGLTVVVVTHDEELAKMSDRQIVMRDGVVIE